MTLAGTLAVSYDLNRLKSNVTTFGCDVPEGFLTSIDTPPGNGEGSYRVTGLVDRGPPMVQTNVALDGRGDLRDRFAHDELSGEQFGEAGPRRHRTR